MTLTPARGLAAGAVVVLLLPLLAAAGLVAARPTAPAATGTTAPVSQQRATAAADQALQRFVATLPVATPPAPAADVTGFQPQPRLRLAREGEVAVPPGTAGVTDGPFPSDAGPVVSLYSTSYITDGADPYQFTAVVTPDGALRVLDRGPVRGVRVSPDGRQVGLGKGVDADLAAPVTVLVLDVMSGRTVARLQQPAQTDLLAWTDGGLLLAGPQGTSPVLWRPGVGVTPLSGRAVVAAPASPSRVLLDGDDGCLRALDPATSVTGPAFGCGTPPDRVQLSSRGTYALVGDQVVVAATGRAAARQPPAPLWGGYWVWQDDRTLRRPVMDPGRDSPLRVWCDLVDGGCWRSR